MMSITYEQALADHTHLWEAHGPAADMTGGYVDQDDLAKLLRKPTKATARDCLVRQIEYWFEVGPDIGSGYGAEIPMDDPRVVEIYERYIG